MASSSRPGSLRTQPLMLRLALTLLVLTIVGGFAASGLHMVDRYANRDQQPGLSMDDLVGAFHGITTAAPMARALDTGHPDEIEGAALLDTDRRILQDWLAGDRISEDFDNLDLGDSAPVEILDRNCLECHSRQATAGDGVGLTIPMDFWDDVQRLAFSRRIEPNSTEIVIASTHTHALSLAVLLCVIIGLAAATRWSTYRLIQALMLVAAAGLLADIGGWWLTRFNGTFAYMIVIGGLAFALATAILLLVILSDLWWPRPPVAQMSAAG